MLSRLARDMLIYGASHLAGRLVTLVLLPILAAVLSPEDFGAVDLTLALSAFALVTVALEVSQGLARNYPEATTDRERTVLAGSAMSFGVLAYGLFGVAALIAASTYGRILMGRTDGPVILAAGIAWVCAAGLLSIAQVPLRFGLRPGAYAISNFALAATSGVAVVLLVVGARTGPAGLLAGQAVGASVGAATAIWLGRPSLPFAIDKSLLKDMLRFSVPLVPASVAAIATGWVDRLAIAAALSLHDLGQYAVAVRIGALVGLLVGAFQATLAPLAYSYHKDPDTPATLARMARLYAGASVLIVASLVWLGPELVRVLAGDAYAQAAPVVPIVAAVPLFVGFANLAPGLAISRSTIYIAAIAITSATLTTFLTFTLIPRFGIIAAAWSSAFGAGVALVLTIVGGQARYRVPWEKAPLFVAVATVIVLGLLTVAINVGGIATLPVRSGLFAVATLTMLTAGLIQRRDVVDVLTGLRTGWKRDGQP